MLQAGGAGPLERDRRKFLAPPLAIDLELYDLDLDVVADGVVGAHRAVDRSAVVELPVDVLEEVGGRPRRVLGVDRDLDSAFFGLEDDERARLRSAEGAQRDDQDNCQLRHVRHRRTIQRPKGWGAPWRLEATASCRR